VNPYFDARRSHHTPEGFRNNYLPNPAYKRPEVGFVNGWIGRLRNWTRGKESFAPRRALDPVAPDLALLHSHPTTPALTWIGHNTFLLQTGSGLNILTDPVFEDRASPLPFVGPRRHQPPGVAMKDLPHIDAVMISHGHYDHLSRSSMQALYHQKGGAPVIFAPLGVDRWLAENVTGGDVSKIVRLDWWDSAQIGDAKVTLLPVQHWSARTPWDRNTMLWGAFALERENGFRFFYSGDLGYSKDIADIAKRFDRFDLGIIGVGAYEPIWYRNSHASPEEAVQIHRELRIGKTIAGHWGTFPMGNERLDEAIDDLATAKKQQGIPEEAFDTMRHGQTLKWEPDSALTGTGEGGRRTRPATGPDPFIHADRQNTAERF
jgi:N-acyl-phosphatidylethanolamine-hydrolysing phospholipase D